MEPQDGNRISLRPRPKLSHGVVIVAVIFFIQLIVFSVSDSFGVFVIPWMDEFAWTRGEISGAYSLAFFVSGALGIVMGMITDKYGPRLALSICAISLGAGLILVSRMHDLWQLYLFYGLIFGVGMSGIWAPLLSLVSRWFMSRRGLITGIVVSGGGLGAFLGPPVITWLISRYSWPRSTMLLGVFVLVAVLLASQLLRRGPIRTDESIDTVRKACSPDAESLECYSFREATRTPQFWTIFLMLFCLSFYTFSILVHYVPHAIQLGVPKYGAAYVLSTISGVSIFGNWVMGRAGDRLGPRKVFIISFALMSAAIFWLVPASQLWMLYLFSIVFGFNHGGNATAQAPLTARIFGLRAHGIIFGAVSFGFTLGGAIGPLVTGYVFDLTGRYWPAWIVCGIVGILGLALATTLKPTERIATCI